MLPIVVTLLTAHQLVVPAPKPRQASVDATIARAQSAWAKVTTLRATFDQSITNPITGSEMASKGTLQQRKPNKLAITFTQPSGDRIVADGKYVWVFLQSATPGQVVKLANTDVGAASTDLIGQFLSTPRSKYDASDAGTEKVNGRTARALVLTAKSGQRLPFIRAKVWVDSADALIRQFESTDANGISRKVKITAMSPNAAVQSAAFVFKVPDGVRIIER
jgi:outer membrane lipoprotein carrier protein